jgi:hypothetical protein
MLLDDPKGEGVLVGILSSETEDSISRKFERSSGHVAQVAAGARCSLVLQHCHLMQKNRVSLHRFAASEQQLRAGFWLKRLRKLTD